MGVHDLNATREAKKLLGIPADEPIFILRAQDILYPAAIAAYEALYLAAIRAGGAEGMTNADWEFSDHLDACRDNGRIWQKKNKDNVKIPD